MLTFAYVPGASQFPFGGDVSVILPMRSSAGTLGGAQNWVGSRPLKPVHCSIAPGSLTGTFRPIVPNTAESVGLKHTEIPAVWAYSVCGGFERRGVKAGPQATAESGAQRPLRLGANPPLELV